MLKPYTFKIASVADCLALCALINSAYRGESSKKGWTTEADLLGGQRTDPDTLRDLILDPLNVMITATLEPGAFPSPSAPTRGLGSTPTTPALHGTVYLRREAGKGYIGMLTVDPELQNSGLGRSLLEYSEDFIRREWKLSEARMTVISIRHELLAWYERRGYRATGEHEPFPYGNVKNGLPRRPDLEFVVLEKRLS